MVIAWHVYAVMRSVTGAYCQRTRVLASLPEVRLRRVVRGRCLMLRLLLIPLSVIRRHSCENRAQLARTLGFSTRAYSPPPRTVPISHPLACPLPPIENPFQQSFLLARGEDGRSFDRLLRDDVHVAGCVPLRSTRDRSLLALTYHLFLFALRLFCLSKLGSIVGGIAAVVGPSLLWIFLLVNALQRRVAVLQRGK